MKIIMLILSTMLFASCGGVTSDYSEKLPGGYQFISESKDQSFIYGKNKQYIPCSVISYAFNNDFILVYQQPSELCIHTEATGIKIANIDVVQFWIIDVQQESLMGPFTLLEFLNQRKKMGVPNELELKIKI